MRKEELLKENDGKENLSNDIEIKVESISEEAE